MSALTIQDQRVGYFCLGVLVTLVIAGLSWLVRELLAEHQEKRAARLGLRTSDYILCTERRPSLSMPYRCTHHLGHRGDHVATDSKGRVLATWTNVDEMPPLRTVGEQRRAGEWS